MTGTGRDPEKPEGSESPEGPEGRVAATSGDGAAARASANGVGGAAAGGAGGASPYEGALVEGSDGLPEPNEAQGEVAVHLSDFERAPRVFLISALALAVGALSAGVALGLLDLIGFFTHLLYYQNMGVKLVPPTLSHIHAWSIVVPIGGGLVVGAMAYWGSEQIRGHGIPEAMETILVGGSKVQPRLAILKPISSAVSIGTGGPFGAEGPIILTGGALGSVLAQFLHLTASERRTLLVAGACGGMSAVFGTPVAAALFGVELLVFEWKVRSVAPIGIAVVVAEIFRTVFASHHLVRTAPLFPVPPHGVFPPIDIAVAAFVGIVSAGLAWVLTTAVYGAEDLFKKLPIHWGWWPALGGLVVGVGGLIDPRALGVGYIQIGYELAGRLGLGALALLLIVKLVIWSMALGSGTSGGILAPLLMMGAALGGIMAPILPGSEATWCLIGMGGTLAGVTRSPFTSVIFAFELTHDTGSLLPLLAACMISHVVSTQILPRSILTEKVARRGFHVVREYAVEPLEALFVREAMLAKVKTLLSDQTVSQAFGALQADPVSRRQHLYPVLDESGEMTGAVGYSGLLEAMNDGRGDTMVSQIALTDLVTASADETLRSAADRMAEKWLTALPVLDKEGRLIGMLTQFDLLKARHRQLVEERFRERVLTLWSGPGVSRRRFAPHRVVIGVIERRRHSTRSGDRVPAPMLPPPSKAPPVPRQLSLGDPDHGLVTPGAETGAEHAGSAETGTEHAGSTEHAGGAESAVEDGSGTDGAPERVAAPESPSDA